MMRKADFLVNPSGTRRFMEKSRKMLIWHENRICPCTLFVRFSNNSYQPVQDIDVSFAGGGNFLQ